MLYSEEHYMDIISYDLNSVEIVILQTNVTNAQTHATHDNGIKRKDKRSIDQLLNLFTVGN